MMRSLRAAVWLLREVTLPSLAHHRLRSALTLLGVVIGVQVVVAIGLLNRSVLQSFQSTVDTLAGGADLQVSNSSAGIPDTLPEDLAGIAGVRSAAPLVQGRITTEWGDLTIFGVDLFGDQEARSRQIQREDVSIPRPYEFVSAPDSIAVSRAFAERAALALGDSFEFVGVSGLSRMTVRGFLEPVRAASLFGGSVGVMDLEPAQLLLGRTGLVDQVDIVVREGADAAHVAHAIEQSLAGLGTVEPPRSRAARLGGMLSSVQTMLTFLSLFAMIVGAFIVYHSLETSIAHRKHDLALARAIGYRRNTVVTATMLEALAFGMVGSVIGVSLGALSASLALETVTTGVSAIWARIDQVGLAVAPSDVLIALGVGLGSSLLAAVPAARSAARASIMDQLTDLPTSESDQSSAWSTLTGPALILSGSALLLLPLRPEGFWARILLIMSGVVVVALGYAALAPWVTKMVVAGPRRVAARFGNLPLAIASDNIWRDARKARGAVAALMLAFAMVLIANSIVRSLSDSLLGWVNQTLACDLYVSPGPQLPLPSGPTLAASLEDSIRRVPGIADVSVGRMITVRVGDALTILRTDTPSGLQRQQYPMLAGGGKEFYEGFANGTSVLVSDNLAFRQRLNVGDTLTFDTPSGRQSFSIGGIAIDYTLDIGAVVLAHATFQRIWQDDRANIIGVWVDPSASPETVGAAISRALPPTVRALVMTGKAFNQNIAGALDQALVATQAIQLVAIAIAIMGVTNFFLAAMIDRRREIGLLRSVALKGRQIFGLYAWEALLLGIAGGVLALAFALPISYLLVTRSVRLVSGWQLTFVFPVAVAVATLLTAAATSVAGAYYPVRRATRQSIVELIAYE